MRTLKKIYCLLLLLMLGAEAATAQTSSQQSQYLTNYSFINPAFTGLDGYPQVRGGFRRQWVGIPGAPSINWLSGSMQLGNPSGAEDSNGWMDNSFGRPSVNDKGHALGATLYNAQAGPYSSTHFNVSFSYHLPLTANSALSMGFLAGLQQSRYNTSKVIYPDSDIDPVVMGVPGSQLSPDMGMGVVYYTPDFFAGTSLLQVLPVKYAGGSSKDRKKTASITSFGYSFNLNETGTRLWMSTLLKAEFGGSFGFDINAKCSFKDLLWVGTSFRLNEAIGVFAGVNVNPAFSISYLYDNATGTSFGGSLLSSHELSIGYRFLKTGQRPVSKIGW